MGESVFIYFPFFVYDINNYTYVYGSFVL
ncbi:uncharacterized protein METZ01_LOCUS477510 [marine metagenome]|uniref:Uncharacterized protein n=1 Tax=marine metagenome TaxID=408172 RepID=A0A383BWN3_9ZZZZ